MKSCQNLLMTISQILAFLIKFKFTKVDEIRVAKTCRYNVQNTCTQTIIESIQREAMARWKNESKFNHKCSNDIAGSILFEKIEKSRNGASLFANQIVIALVYFPTFSGLSFPIILYILSYLCKCILCRVLFEMFNMELTPDIFL